MIDLERFVKEKEVVVPIVEGWGQYDGRKIYAPNIEASYYRATLRNSALLHGRASPLEVQKTLTGRGGHRFKIFAIGEEGVATNFDTFLRKGFGESVKVNFLNVRLFEVVEIVLWEDGRFYFYDTILPKNRAVIQQVKQCFESDQELTNIKGISPELRYFFLLASLQRQGFRAAEEMEKYKLSELEREKRVAEFNASFPGRLKNTVTRAGGKFIRYSRFGNGYLVEWKLGHQLIKSTIKDNMRIINAGFCLSGDDKKHTIASVVNLAKLFRRDAPLYITRE